MTQNRSNTGVSVGGSSILVIFVLLCLTTFATLSLVSANADKSLTSKTAVATSEYYQADAKAEEIFAKLDTGLKEIYGTANNRKDFMDMLKPAMEGIAPEAELSDDEISYKIPLNDHQELIVILEIADSIADDGLICRKKTWKVINTGDWQPADEGFNLWDGNDNLVLFAQ